MEIKWKFLAYLWPILLLKALSSQLWYWASNCDSCKELPLDLYNTNPAMTLKWVMEIILYYIILLYILFYFISFHSIPFYELYRIFISLSYVPFSLVWFSLPKFASLANFNFSLQAKFYIIACDSSKHNKFASSFYFFSIF